MNAAVQEAGILEGKDFQKTGIDKGMTMELRE
jgi:hypothetical protein